MLHQFGWGLGTALGIVIASYGAYIAVVWLGYGRPAQAGGAHDSLLDQFMTVYDVVERHHIRVAAPAETTMAAAYDLDLGRLPIVRGIFRARELVLGSRPETRVLPRPLLAQMEALGWRILAEVPGREVVVGAVTQPWAADVVFRAVPPHEFAAFHEPGYVKIVWTLRADPLGPSASIARHETRAVATDPAARNRFRWYWSVFSPGIKLIRSMALGLVRGDAERRMDEGRPAGQRIELHRVP